MACCNHNHDCEEADCGPAYSLYKHIDQSHVSVAVPMPGLTAVGMWDRHSLAGQQMQLPMRILPQACIQAAGMRAGSSGSSRSDRMWVSACHDQSLTCTACTDTLPKRGRGRQLQECVQTMVAAHAANGAPLEKRSR